MAVVREFVYIVWRDVSPLSVKKEAVSCPPLERIILSKGPKRRLKRPPLRMLHDAPRGSQVFQNAELRQGPQFHNKTYVPGSDCKVPQHGLNLDSGLNFTPKRRPKR